MTNVINISNGSLVSYGRSMNKLNAVPIRLYESTMVVYVEDIPSPEKEEFKEWLDENQKAVPEFAKVPNMPEMAYWKDFAAFSRRYDWKTL